MVQAVPVRDNVTTWVDVCPLAAIAPNTGVCALVEGEQVAVFRVGNGAEVYAIANYDPFSKAFVLSRGIVGDRNGVLKVASPIYKQNFSLLTGQCLDDETVKIPTFTVRVVDNMVQVAGEHPHVA
ncbi:nitrite reductase small subunit NirD [Kamptonema animale CS-326]|jgi:nitrite reductase (NADH) small subunit|uniref:nitrite reductase small subunit NirD n=1 Tax=Kamptonema animale TaxID=92934 RepID=UPI00232CDF2A|nr:nitrite reductase small subunit NirD [Kamptonema animale]MDB9509954.1 nitrite reductase small subunit NirD [Kamptonema animale CS-326]